MPDFLSPQVIGFFLVFARVGAMVMLLPALGDEQVPARVRLAIALGLALVIMPLVMLQMPRTPQTLLGVGGLLVQEVVIGLMIGAAARLIMSALQIAGTIIGMQSGLAIAMAFDPASGVQSAVPARLLAVLAVVMIFALNLHHLLIGGIVRSYVTFSPGDGLMVADFAQLATQLVAQSCALGVQLAAPFLVYGIIFNLGLGILSRLVPTLQVFFIAQPLTMLLSFLLWFAVLALMMNLFLSRFESTFRALVGG